MDGHGWKSEIRSKLAGWPWVGSTDASGREQVLQERFDLSSVDLFTAKMLALKSGSSSGRESAPDWDWPLSSCQSQWTKRLSAFHSCYGGF